MLNVSSTSTTKEQLEQLCNTTIDNSQDFTDSVYISIEQREKVLDYHKKLQDQLADIVKSISEVCVIVLSFVLLNCSFVETKWHASSINSNNSTGCTRISLSGEWSLKSGWKQIRLFSWNKWQCFEHRNSFVRMMKVSYLTNWKLILCLVELIYCKIQWKNSVNKQKSPLRFASTNPKWT